MKDINNIIRYAQQALSEAGTDFALSGARRYLIYAINELSHVQKKRKRREDNLQKEHERVQYIQKLSKEEAKKRMKMLDDMFKETENEIQKRNANNSQEN